MKGKFDAGFGLMEVSFALMIVAIFMAVVFKASPC